MTDWNLYKYDMVDGRINLIPMSEQEILELKPLDGTAHTMLGDVAPEQTVRRIKQSIRMRNAYTFEEAIGETIYQYIAGDISSDQLKRTIAYLEHMYGKSMYPREPKSTDDFRRYLEFMVSHGFMDSSIYNRWHEACGE